MQSKTSFFNWGIFKKTVSRFWPIYTAYFLIWALAMPLEFVNNPYSEEIPFQIVQSIPSGSTLMSLIFSCISAVAVFSYLYNLRSCVMMHSVPVRREAMFTSNYLAGLSFTVVPNVLIYILSAVVVAANGCMNGEIMTALSIWLLSTCVMCLFFYSFAVLLSMITGTWFMMPIIYGILNFTAVIIESIVHAALEVLVYGYMAGRSVMQVFSPAVYMMSNFDFYKWNDNRRILAADTEIWVYMAILAVVGIVFAAVSVLIYKKRHMENAGEIIAISCLRPIFKYCFASGCAIVIGAFIFGITGFATGFAMYVCAVIGGAIGYFAATMAIKKSFRLKTSAFKGFAVFTAAVTLLFAGVVFDLFGIASYVPNASNIKNAVITIDGEYLDVTDGDISLADLIKIHRRIVAQKDESTELVNGIYGTSSYVPVDKVISVRIEYQTDWRTVKRYYRIPLTEELLAAPGSAQALMADAVTDMDYILKKFSWIYENGMPYGVSVELYGNQDYADIIEAGVGKDVDLEGQSGIKWYINITEPDGRIEELVRALKNDIQSGVYQVFGTERDNVAGDVYYYYMIEDTENYYVDYFGERHTESKKVSELANVYPGGELEKLMLQYILAENNLQ